MGVLAAIGMESPQSEEAANLMKAASKGWSDIVIPNPEDLFYEIERYRTEAGIENPEMLFTGDLARGPTELGGIETEQDVLDAQRAAMTGLTDVAQEGITATEAAQMQGTMTEEALRQKGAREAILQNFQERGIGGSGQELAAQLLNQQASADRGAQTAFDISALGKQRALEALTSSGDLASRVRGQEFGEQAQTATAQDAIAAFNLNQEAQTRQANVDRGYDAALNRQRIGMAQADQTTQQRAQLGESLKYVAAAQMDQAAGAGAQMQAEAAALQAANDAQNAALKNTIGTAATVVGGIYGGPAGAAAARGATDAALACGGKMEGYRANGGGVDDGGTYMVGELGPELVTPAEDGMVHSAKDTDKILEAITGMNYTPGGRGHEEGGGKEMMPVVLNDIQERLRNLEMRGRM